MRQLLLAIRGGCGENEIEVGREGNGKGCTDVSTLRTQELGVRNWAT